MLSKLRHINKWLLILVTVVVAIGFTMMYSESGSFENLVGNRGQCVIKVYDRCYRSKELMKLQTNFFVARDMGMYEFASVLFGRDRMDQDPTNFAISLLVLRKEAEKLGVVPTDQEVTDAIPKLPIFQQPFMSVNSLKTRIMDPYGFNESDLYQLVKDYLSYERLKGLIAAGVVSLPAETEKFYLRSNQLYTASVIRFNRADHIEKVQITDEDIQKYYDENAKDLLTDAKRGFDYVKFTAKPAPEGLSAEEVAKRKRDFGMAVNTAYADLSAEGARFIDVAAQYEGDKADFVMEKGKLDAFGLDEAPELVKDRSNVVNELFNPNLVVGAVTIPLAGDEGEYFVFHFSEDVQPRPLTLEEAKPGITTALENIKSNQAVNDAASVALAKLKEGVAAGKAFAEVAKEAGLTVEALPKFSAAEPPAGVADGSLILRTADSLVKNETSAVVERPDGEGVLLVHVDNIEIYKDENKEDSLREIAAETEVGLGQMLFIGWLKQRLVASDARDNRMAQQLAEEQL